jgi:hypothetical protein
MVTSDLISPSTCGCQAQNVQDETLTLTFHLEGLSDCGLRLPGLELYCRILLALRIALNPWPSKHHSQAAASISYPAQAHWQIWQYRRSNCCLEFQRTLEWSSLQKSRGCGRLPSSTILISCQKNSHLLAIYYAMCFPPA